MGCIKLGHDDVSGRVLQKGRSNCLPIRTIEQSWPEPRRLPCSPRRARAPASASQASARAPVPPSAKFRKRELVPALPDHLRASVRPPSAVHRCAKSKDAYSERRPRRSGTGAQKKRRVSLSRIVAGEREAGFAAAAAILRTVFLPAPDRIQTRVFWRMCIEIAMWDGHR